MRKILTDLQSVFFC